MDKSQAIKSLSVEIAINRPDLYAFQPKGQEEKFFISEAILTAAATALLTAFLNGLQSALQPRVQKWGEALGIWVSDELESLFKAPPSFNEQLDRAISSVKSLVSVTSAEQKARAAQEVQKVIEDTLSKHGVLQNRAAAIATRTNETAMQLATGG